MDAARDALPDDITALKEALIIERAKGLEVAAELAVARAKASEDVALIAQQKLRISQPEAGVQSPPIGSPSARPSVKPSAHGRSP